MNFLAKSLSLLLIVSALAACTPPTPLPTATPTLIPTVTITPIPSLTPTPKVTSPADAGWKLIWSDEFAGPTGALPDPQKWTYETGGSGWGNAEHEIYTNDPQNAALDGSGNLAITARAIDPAANPPRCWYGECQYSSARLLTKNLYAVTYGRIEARIKIPAGQGLWPAFWMLGSDVDTTAWPACGEIDIMENLGKEPDIIHGTLHGPGYSGGNSKGQPYRLKTGSYADDFHVYAIEWAPDEIRWFMDNRNFLNLKPENLPGRWVYDHPFFILLNLAVGGNWPGYPDATTLFPQSMLVDYVRVYQH